MQELNLRVPNNNLRISDSVAGLGAATLLCALTFGALFFPTSQGGEFNPYLDLIPITLLLLALPFISRSVMLTQLALASAGLSLLLLSTLGSPFSSLALGAVKGFVAAFALFSVRLASFEACYRLLRSTLIAINLTMVLLGLAVFLNVDVVQVLLRDWYSGFEPGLVEFLVTDLGKPVATFISHSSAAYFYMLFLILNVETYRANGTYGYLLAGVMFLFLHLLLTSVSGLAFFLLGLIYIAYRYPASSRARRVISVSIGSLVLCALLVVYIAPISEHVGEILLFGGSGFLGRYSQTGVLSGTFAYMAENPFSPVGLTYSPDVFFADSGLVEYTLRGSIILPLCMYTAWYRFTRSNLLQTAHFRIIFWTAMLFELGFSVLTLSRFIAFLPFVVVYLNCLDRAECRFLQNPPR